jgi:hypothetical protein
VLTIRTNGQSNSSITVNQAGGTSCSYRIIAPELTMQAEGQLGEFSFEAGENCPVNPLSDVPWIEASSLRPASSVRLRVARNPTRVVRRGTVKLGNAEIVVYQLGDPQMGTGFVPVDSCRLVDTRSAQFGTPGSGPPPLIGGQSRTFTVAGRCGVPAAARAFVLNITAYPINNLTYLTMWPANAPQPLASILNSFDGRVASNVAVIPAGKTNSQVSAYASHTTNLTIDVIGYFADPSSESLVLYPVAPCRVTDTRITNTPLMAGTTRDVRVSGRCGIPSGAAAVSLNVTAVPRGALGSLTVWPAGRPKPAASTLNAPNGTVAANASLVAIGTAGGVSVSASNETDFLLDVNGYFGPPSDTGLYFHAQTPCRILDTRNTPAVPLAAGAVRTIAPGSAGCDVPSTARAYLLNTTAVPPGPLAFLSIFPAPIWTGSSTLNAFDGQVTANLAIVADHGQGIGAYASGPSHLVLDVSGYFATLPPELRRPTLVPVP